MSALVEDFSGRFRTLPWLQPAVTAHVPLEGSALDGFGIACQTITWGEGQRERFPQVFAEVAAAGFAGVEIGFRHIRSTPPEELNRMLGDAGLSMVASHVGGNLLDSDQAGQERRMLDEVLDYLETAGTKLLMYSGLRYKDDAQFSRDMAMLNESAARCRERGVSLLYHNHNWEFADGGRVIKALLHDGASDLGFCPDVGWVMKGGMDIVEFLEAAKDRIGAMHFKDFATRADCVDTVILGEGVAPLKEAAEWLRQQSNGMWVIAEQDRADVSCAEAALGNAAFLRTVFGA
jgi:sugar phosphate isomerase/epimerase